jgi:hypothetical protein
MTEIPRRRAQINGLLVIFESRNPKLASVRWHSRFKLRYRTKIDVLAAKEVWEMEGRIMFPGDFGKTKAPKAVKPRVQVRVREAGLQQEMCL